MWNFYNVEFENGRGFLKIHVFDKRTGFFDMNTNY